MLTPEIVMWLNLGVLRLIAAIKSLGAEFPDAGLITDVKMSELSTAKHQDVLDLIDKWESGEGLRSVSRFTK